MPSADQNAHTCGSPAGWPSQGHVKVWKGTAELGNLGYPTAWNMLLKRYGINRLQKEDYEDKIRAFVPKSDSFKHQLEYIQQFDSYCGILVNCSMHQDDIASLAIPHMQRKIRRDVWSTVRIFLGVNDTNVDTWFGDDPFTKFRILWKKILGNLIEISDHEKFTDSETCSAGLMRSKVSRDEDRCEDPSERNSEEEEFSGHVPGGHSQRRGSQSY